MSSCPTPLTRPERPPYRGGPPIRTTFDGWYSGDPEPEYEVYLESAELLLRMIDVVSQDGSWSLALQLKLLQQRQKWLEEQLWGMRSIAPSSLPPIHGFDMIDLFESPDSLELRLVRMLDRLNEAILKVNGQVNMQNCPFPSLNFDA